MLAQESILETTVQTETESVTTETSQTVANWNLKLLAKR